MNRFIFRDLGPNTAAMKIFLVIYLMQNLAWLLLGKAN